MDMTIIPDCVSGIYAIKNTASGRIYVGSAQNISERWKCHRYQLDRGIHHAPRLQLAWLKNNPDAFLWIVLEFVPVIANLVVREQYWMDIFQVASWEHGYNTVPNAGSSRGHKHRPEVVAANRARLKGKKRPPRTPEWSANISAGKLAAKFKHTDEERARIGARQLGKKKPKMTLEQRKRISDAHLGHRNSPASYAKQTASITAYWAARTPEQRQEHGAKCKAGRLAKAQEST